MAGEDSMGKDPRQTRRVVLGSLLVAALLGAALLIFFLDDMLRSMRSRYTIVAVVQAAPGLAEGSPVWIAGRHVGEVLTVGFTPARGDSLARIAVTLELPREAAAQVRKDSRVRLTSVGIISERVVDILPGTAAAPILQPGDTLRQDLLPTPAQLTARAALVKADLDSVRLAARALTPALRARLLQTQRAFAGLDGVMQEAGRLQRDMDANPGLALLQDPAFAASLERASATFAELPRLFGELSGVDGNATQVAAALTRLQARGDSLRALLDSASQRITLNGSLARFQQDSAVQRAIGAARAELDSLMAEIRRNPLRFAF